MSDGLDDPFAPLPPIEASDVALGPGDIQLREPPAGSTPPDRHRNHGRPTARWCYKQADGQLFAWVCRFDRSGSKSFAVQAYGTIDGRKGWHWRRPPGKAPLYGMADLFRRPDTRVLVVEGEKVADAARRLFPELVVVTSMSGARAAERSDWSPLQGRTVVIWPDHDEPGRAYAAAVRCLAEAAGAASVAAIELPAAWPPGWDLADALPDGCSAAQLTAMLVATLPSSLPPACLGEYRRDRHGLWWLKPGKEGRVDEIQLTNFPAAIVGDVVRDDGTEQSRWFELEAVVGGQRLRMLLPAADYASMNWVTQRLGPTAVIAPGLTLKDRTRHAIQMLSDRVEQRRIYTHTGWRSFDEGWGYLHVAGAVGRDGPVPGIATDLDSGGLSLFHLPPPPRGQARVRAIQSTLRLLDVAPRTITAPLLAAVARAVLGSADFSLWLLGRTGVFKSQLAALAQQHWGRGLDAQHLPGSWSSTANALEGLTHAAADAVVVVDDFAPGATRNDSRELQGKAARLARNQGNGAGRQRMRADATLRPPRPPRGLIIGTGEDLPTGHSIRARLLIVEVGRNDVDPARLTACQRDAESGLYAETLSAFIAWLATDRDARIARYRERRDELRLGDHAGHRRTPWIAADLVAALELFLQFAREADALEEHVASALSADLATAVRQVAAGQAEHHQAEDPALTFIELVGAALRSGRVHVEDADRPGHAPCGGHRWGWQRAYGGANAGDNDGWRPSGRRIGWLRAGVLYFDPNAAYATAQQLAHQQGRELSTSPRTLWCRLHEAGLLAFSDQGRHTKKVRVDGRSINALAIAADRVWLPETGTSGTQPDEADNVNDNAVPAEFPIDRNGGGSGTSIGNSQMPGNAGVPDSRSRCHDKNPPNGNGADKDCTEDLGLDLTVPDVPDGAQEAPASSQPDAADVSALRRAAASVSLDAAEDSAEVTLRGELT